MIEKIAHITDLHLDEAFPFNDKTSARKRFHKILDDIIKNGITHVVCTGDIGENKGIPYFFDQLKKMNLSITLGNHDEFVKICNHYNLGADYSSKKIYSSTLKNHLKFIYLDSSSGSIDIKQLAWLKRALVTSRPIIIFMHHPVIGLPLKVDEIGKLKNRKEVIKVLANVPNEIIIYCGHYHMESTLIYKNIKQYISPAVAYQIEKNKDKIAIDTTITGYRIIQIEANKCSSNVITLHAD